MVNSLWLFHQHATAAATDPQNDERLKSVLTKATATDFTIHFSEIGDFMSSERFQSIAGNDETIDEADIVTALQSSIPSSRSRLYDKIRRHLECLTTTFDMIDDQHGAATRQLSEWMISRYASKESLEVIVVCTGNSRRSMLGAAMGNAAASYYGLDKVKFYSGGTEPSAFNTRSITALKEIGFQFESTGEEAPGGDLHTPNHKFKVQWGQGLEMIEFSKHFASSGNPQHDFAALMVCSEADAECPRVPGATLRLAMPYLDPKVYDDSSLESVKYAERRDDIGRTMLAAMCQVQRAMHP